MDARVRTAAADIAPRTRVCALLTCFNRRDKTLECLRALAASSGLDRVSLSAVLVDDGSSDGTARAVRAEFAWVEVVESDGSLYWCRGMHLAFQTALRKQIDHFLWLNDDTSLLPDALERLIECETSLRERTDAPLIVVGNTTDAVTGAHTYGGERQPSRLAPFRVERVALAAAPQRCDTMTGNIVLVSAAAARRVGNLDPSFEHAMGDTDYALRARRLGVELWVAPGVQGHCSANPVTGTYRDEALPLAVRWNRMMSRKGLPLRSWLIFTRRHTGVMWPLYFTWPYFKLVVVSCVTRLRRHTPS